MRTSETRRHTCGHCGTAIRVVNGKWLREIRVGADVTMARMAKFYAGVSVQLLNNIEMNRRLCPPSVEQAYRTLKTGNGQ